VCVTGQSVAWATTPVAITGQVPENGARNGRHQRDACAVVNITGLELALIPAGSALAGVALGIAGQGWLDTRRDRRAAVRERDQAIAELLTATVDIVQGVQAVRGAYQARPWWRHHVLAAGTVLSALGNALPGKPGTPYLQKRSDWSLLLDWRIAGPAIDRLLAADRQLDETQRRVALDLNTVLLPRTARFYAAVSVLTLGPDEELADAVRKLTPAVAALLDVITAKQRKYDRTRYRAEKALRKFRAEADKRRR